MDNSRRTTSEPFLAPTTSCWKTVTTWRNVRQRQRRRAPGLEGTEHESLSRNLFFWVNKDIAPSTCIFQAKFFWGKEGMFKVRSNCYIRITNPDYQFQKSWRSVIRVDTTLLPLNRHTRRCGKPIKTNDSPKKVIYKQWLLRIWMIALQEGVFALTNQTIPNPRFSWAELDTYGSFAYRSAELWSLRLHSRLCWICYISSSLFKVWGKKGFSINPSFLQGGAPQL